MTGAWLKKKGMICLVCRLCVCGSEKTNVNRVIDSLSRDRERELEWRRREQCEGLYKGLSHARAPLSHSFFPLISYKFEFVAVDQVLEMQGAVKYSIVSLRPLIQRAHVSKWGFFFRLIRARIFIFIIELLKASRRCHLKNCLFLRYCYSFKIKLSLFL